MKVVGVLRPSDGVRILLVCLLIASALYLGSVRRNHVPQNATRVVSRMRRFSLRRKPTLDESLHKKYQKMFRMFERMHPHSKRAWRTHPGRTKYRILETTFECKSGDLGHVRGVFWSVIARRKERLEVQEEYWTRLHTMGLIREVHLWDVTSGESSGANASRDWIVRKSKEHNFVKRKGAKTEGERDVFLKFFEYYARKLGRHDIVLKVDEDVFWLNTTELPCFMKYVHDQKHHLVVSANTMNSKQLGHFGLPPGKQTRTLQHNDPNKAKDLEEHFPSNKSRSWIVQCFGRCHTNFLGFNYRTVKEGYEIVKYVHNHPTRFVGTSGETALTTFANGELNRTHVLYMKMVAER